MLQELSGFTRLLNSLTPAESLFLLNPKGSSSLDLLKVSLLDLNVKRIIDFKFHNLDSENADYSYHTLEYIKNSNQQELKPHEQMIIQVFKRFNNSIPSFRYKALLRNNRLKKLFYFDNIYLTLVEEGLFNNMPLLPHMGFYLKSSKGKKLSKFLKKFIPYCENNIDDWIENDPSQLVDLLNKFDNNVLISKSQYLFWKSIDYFNSLPNKENNNYISSLSSNHMGRYIRYYCSDQDSVVDFRDVAWGASDFSSGGADTIHDDAMFYAMH
jgi:hypothetical protein